MFQGNKQKRALKQTFLGKQTKTFIETNFFRETDKNVYWNKRFFFKQKRLLKQMFQGNKQKRALKQTFLGKQTKTFIETDVFRETNKNVYWNKLFKETTKTFIDHKKRD